MHMSTKADNTAIMERLQGYMKAMSDAGIEKSEIPSYIHLHEFSEMELNHLEAEKKWTPGYTIAKAALAKVKDFPISVFCLNDYMAKGLYEAAKEMNLEIGREIAVIGFDDMTIASRMAPTLSSVRQDFAGMGYRAAALLDELIEVRTTEPVKITIPIELAIRDSSSIP